MHWRGVTLKDVVYGTCTLGALCAMTFLLIYAMIMSLL